MARIDWLERKFGHLAIPGLIRFVVAFNALVFVLMQVRPGYVSALTLDSAAILRGEVWRLVTYVFIPGSNIMIVVLIGLLFLWMLGEGLEQEWGAFRLNLFYFTGMAGCTVAAFFFGGESTNFFLNLSVLFAFATMFPNFTILLFFVLPVKIKWVAWLSAFFVLAALATGPIHAKMAVLASLANVLLFLGPGFIRDLRARSATAERRQRFEEGQHPDEALHRCSVCGRSDTTHPDLAFRVNVDGRDLCTECLKTRREDTP